MTYVVLARKWRPQTFKDMTGQEHIVQTLANSIRLDRVAHAYLFCGPRGVGKTTAARLLAKALNCGKGPTPEPCGVCQACVEITAGNSVDVSEIDGASNNGVENVREIRENAKYLPQRDRNKIYIIDEVHMLSGAAFNALLKTLEEPPGHVKFIFATTEATKLPDTILSRCQRHNFRRIAANRMIERLREICSAEKISVSDRSLALIARQSEGGMRDALSLLDQVVSACGPAASDQAVADSLGAVSHSMVYDFVDGLVRGDSAKVLERCANAYEQGLDLKRVTEEIAFELRHLFVCKATGAAPAELAELDRQALVALAEKASTSQLARLFDIVHESLWDITRTSQPRLTLEMTLLKAIELSPAASIPELISKIQGMTEALPKPAGASGGRSAQGPFRV